MKKYAKIINETTKQCDVGIGTNINYYKSIGMEELDVEQAYNGEWYLQGYLPADNLKSLKDLKQTENNEKCSNYIYSIYPIHKQNNASSFSISNPNGNDLSDSKTNIEVLNEMTNFINQQRSINYNYKKKIDNTKNEVDLKKIVIIYGEESVNI